mgnify:FL=1
MLFLIQSDGSQLDLNCDNYSITHCYNGEEDKLNFTLPRGHSLCAKLKEQARIRETTEERIFSLSSVSRGGDTMSYSAELDLSGLQEKLLLNWASTSADMLGAIRQVLPSGWTAASEVPSTPVLQVEDFNGTPLEFIQKCVEVWDYPCQFAPGRVTIKNPAAAAKDVVPFTCELNLSAQPQYRGRADSIAGTYYTALRLVGDNCTTTATLTDYDSRLIWHYEEDKSISSQTALDQRAAALLKAAAFPVQSFSCSVVDLAKLNPEKYAALSFALYDTVRNIDPDTGTSTSVQIVQYTTYPNYPEKNTVRLNSAPFTLKTKRSSSSGQIKE